MDTQQQHIGVPNLKRRGRDRAAGTYAKSTRALLPKHFGGVPFEVGHPIAQRGQMARYRQLARMTLEHLQDLKRAACCRFWHGLYENDACGLGYEFVVVAQNVLRRQNASRSYASESDSKKH